MKTSPSFLFALAATLIAPLLAQDSGYPRAVSRSDNAQDAALVARIDAAGEVSGKKALSAATALVDRALDGTLYSNDLLRREPHPAALPSVHENALRMRGLQAARERALRRRDDGSLNADASPGAEGSVSKGSGSLAAAIDRARSTMRKKKIQYQHAAQNAFAGELQKVAQRLSRREIIGTEPEA